MKMGAEEREEEEEPPISGIDRFPETERDAKCRA